MPHSLDIMTGKLRTQAVTIGILREQAIYKHCHKTHIMWYSMTHR